MTERVCCFGPDEGLAGVLTEPAKGGNNAPAVLWLNAGLLHSAGPFGWYVTLARRMSEQGIASLRFDISGVGDSPPRADGRSKLQSGVADVVAAMDFLAREHGNRRFVLVGLCSGAILAQQVASSDDRVVGAVLIDGWGFRTTGFWLRHYARRAAHWRPWLNGTKRLFRSLVPATNGSNSVPMPREDWRTIVREFYFDFPAPEAGREQLHIALRRGARLLWVFTGDAEYFNHRRQFREMLGRVSPGSAIEFAHLPAADHLFARREPRLELFRRIEHWCQNITASSADRLNVSQL